MVKVSEMIHKNVQQYFQERWDKSLETITESSKNDAGKSLVVSDKKVYSFDKIVKEMYNNQNQPTSVDAIGFQRANIWFIEFKSGFARRITTENYKEPFVAMRAEEENALKMLKEKTLKLQDKEHSELLYNLKLKAVESYVTFEKKILPLCNDVDYHRNLVLCIVVDNIDDADILEDGFGELAGKSRTSNILSSIRSSLHRYVKATDACDNSYYYDEVKVYSVKEFIAESKLLPETPTIAVHMVDTTA